MIVSLRMRGVSWGVYRPSTGYVRYEQAHSCFGAEFISLRLARRL